MEKPIKKSTPKRSGASHKGNFFELGTQYYVGARYAYHAGLIPICGNLFHHALEMLLKGCQFHAAMTDSEVDQKVKYFSKKIRHRLYPLWWWFKKQPGRPIDELKKYDEVIDGLNEFESLRYPSNTVPLKIGFHFSGLSLPPHAKPTGGPPNLYKLEMEPLDELVRIIFEAEGVNPKLLLFVRNIHSQKYLIPQNKCAYFWIMWPV